MSKMIIVEGNSNDKDNVRVLMVKGEKGDTGDPTKLSQLENDTGFITDNDLNEAVDELNEIIDEKADTTEIQTAINNEVDARTNADSNLQSQISGLASGSPLVASSTAGMTDTSRVYVNTTDGNWYYYNGSAWVSGGLYQSTGIGDNSVTYNKLSKNIQDNFLQATNSLIDMKSYFEIGGVTITNEGWTYSNDTRRARTKEGTTIHLKAGSMLVIPNGKRAYIGYKTADETYWIYSWSTDMRFISVEGDYVFSFARTSSETDITNLDEFLDGFKIICNTSSNAKSIIDGITNTLEKKSSIDSFSYGDVGISGVTATTTRVHSNNFLKTDNDCILNIPFVENVDVYIKAFSSESYSSLLSNGGSGWLQLPVTQALNKDYYYKLIFRNRNNDVITSIVDFTKNILAFINKFNYKAKRDTNYHTPKLVYHRGFSSMRPENTLPAFQFCKDLNCKYVECDVHQTSDGVPVIIHDIDLSRTTDGTGNINEITYEEFKELYITGVQYDQPYTNTLHYPSFEEFIAFCRQNDLYPFIELKETLTNISTVVNLIEEYGMTKNCICFSFTLNLVKAVRSLNPEITVAFMSTTFSETVLNNYVSLGENAGLILDVGQITEQIVERVHNLGGFIGSYVTDTWDGMQELIDMKSDYIITNQLLNNNKINYPAQNLHHELSGTTFDYTIQYVDRDVFADVFEIGAEVYYEGTPPVISVGNMQYSPTKEKEFNMIRLQRIFQNGTTFPVQMTGTNCKFVNFYVRRYKKFK